MPLQLWSKHLWNDRIDFEDSLSIQEVQALIADKDLKVIQCTSPVELATWEVLNSEFFAVRPEVTLRIYGFPLLPCDLSFASKMTNVRHFTADNLLEADHIEAVAEMENLESLGVGIYHLESFAFLNQITPDISRLFLGWTKSKKPDLSPLRRFQSLKVLYLEGHQKNIEVLETLIHLEDVTLRSISTPDVQYLTSLTKMWSLDIKLGGIRNLDAISAMENIKYLELWQVRGLQDLSVVSNLPGLQYLFLQSLPNIRTFPLLHDLSKLRRIFLDNLKGLENLDSLEHAPALEDYIQWGAENVEIEGYLPLLRNPNLKRLKVVFDRQKKNKSFSALLQQYQIDLEQEIGPFEFI